MKMKPKYRIGDKLICIKTDNINWSIGDLVEVIGDGYLPEDADTNNDFYYPINNRYQHPQVGADVIKGAYFTLHTSAVALEVKNKGIAKAFDLWLDDYVNHPETFEDLKITALQHLKERLDGVPATYGQEMVSMLSQYLAKVNQPNANEEF